MTRKRAFWEAFTTVCLPSLLLWSIFAYFLRSKLNFTYAEFLPICLFCALLPMPLAFPVYHRTLKGTSRDTETQSPAVNIVMAILFGVVGIIHATEFPGLLHSHKDVWDVVFQAAITTGWLAMSVMSVRRATRKQLPTSA